MLLYKQGVLTKSDADDRETICDLDFHERHFFGGKKQKNKKTLTTLIKFNLYRGPAAETR